MELVVTRTSWTDTLTDGVLTIDGKDGFFTREDTDRGLDAFHPDTIARKVKGQTAIPVGRYRVKMTWFARHKRKQPMLLDVPGFQGIFIHSGATAEDTEGCILVSTHPGAEFGAHTRNAAAWLERAVQAAEDAGEEVWCEVRRSSAWPGVGA